MANTIYLDVVSKGRGLVTHSSFNGSVIQQGKNNYVVENEFGNVIGYTKSMRTGVHLLAKFYSVADYVIERDVE
jgi:hypothetical protein